MSGAPLRSALKYAERGLRVHPCRPDRKEPILEAWPKLATLDRKQISRWWQQRPDANVAIAIGGPTRLLVVDVDPDAGGEASLAELEPEHGALPATVEAITPRGGRHVYSSCPTGAHAGQQRRQARRGIDTRGQGGYVLPPPSTVNGGLHAGLSTPRDRIAEAPGWLLELLPRAAVTATRRRPRNGRSSRSPGRRRRHPQSDHRAHRRAAVPPPARSDPRRRAGRLFQRSQVPTAARGRRAEAYARQHRRARDEAPRVAR